MERGNVGMDGMSLMILNFLSDLRTIFVSEFDD